MNQKLSKLDQMKALRQLAAERAERAKQKVVSREAAVVSPPPPKPVMSLQAHIEESQPRVFRDNVALSDRKPGWPRVLRAKTGLSAAAFGRLFGVPWGTMKEWSRGAGPTPPWVLIMVSAFASDPSLIAKIAACEKAAAINPRR